MRIRRAAQSTWRRSCAAAVKVWKAGPGISQWATVTAALVTVLAFFFGYRQFRETQEATRQNLTLQREGLDLDRETKAVELFVRYNEMMAEPRPTPTTTPTPTPSPAVGVATPPAQAKPEEHFSWQDNTALAIAESIFKLKREDEGWRATVGWMLSNHTDFLEKAGIDCRTYDAEFIAFVRQTVPRVRCV